MAAFLDASTKICTKVPHLYWLGTLVETLCAASKEFLDDSIQKKGVDSL